MICCLIVGFNTGLLDTGSGPHVANSKLTKCPIHEMVPTVLNLKPKCSLKWSYGLTVLSFAVPINSFCLFLLLWNVTLSK